MIRPRSKKREHLYATQRRALVQKLLTENPMCQRCKKEYADDVHELKTRARGGSITDENNLRCVCRSCHIWITTNPKMAQETGWLKWSWE